MGEYTAKPNLPVLGPKAVVISKIDTYGAVRNADRNPPLSGGRRVRRKTEPTGCDYSKMEWF